MTMEITLWRIPCSKMIMRIELDPESSYLGMDAMRGAAMNNASCRDQCLTDYPTNQSWRMMARTCLR